MCRPRAAISRELVLPRPEALSAATPSMLLLMASTVSGWSVMSGVHRPSLHPRRHIAPITLKAPLADESALPPSFLS